MYGSFSSFLYVRKPGASPFKDFMSSHTVMPSSMTSSFSFIVSSSQSSVLMPSKSSFHWMFFTISTLCVFALCLGWVLCVGGFARPFSCGVAV